MTARGLREQNLAEPGLFVIVLHPPLLWGMGGRKEVRAGWMPYKQPTDISRETTMCRALNPAPAVTENENRNVKAEEREQISKKG